MTQNISPSVLARLLAAGVGMPFRVDSKVRYKVICADCPWPFQDRLPGEGRGAEKNYDVLTISDLCERRFIGGDVIDSADDDAYLFFWRVSAMQEEALRVIRAWGFTVKSEIVWRKQTNKGNRHFGMGRHVRMEHEVCLIATRGKAKPLVRNIRSVFDAPAPSGSKGRAIHSAKPEVFYTKIVERMASGPYAELFARSRRPGWTCVGDEV